MFIILNTSYVNFHFAEYAPDTVQTLRTTKDLTYDENIADDGFDPNLSTVTLL